MIKKLVLSVFVLLFFCGAAFCGPYDAFNYVLNSIGYNAEHSGQHKAWERLAQKYLDSFTKDIGQAIAGGSYGIGGNIGISDINLMLSLKMSYQEVSNGNTIVRTSGESAIYYPIIQAELGFLEKFAGIVRFSYFNDSTLLGGGLRYNILISEDEMYIPSISVQSVYNYLIYNESSYGKFNVWNLKTGTTAYFGLVPYIQPYVFLTYDVTALKPVSSYYSYLDSKEHGFGYGVGASIKVEPLNISFSVSMYDNQPNFSFGAFIGI